MLADLKFDPVPMPAYYPPYGGVPMLSVMDPGQMLAAQQQQGASMGLPPSSPSSGGSKTFQVMKRQNSSKFDNHNSHTHNRDTANGGNRKPQVSGVEKEKIYAAYKAHLFNEEGLATSSSAGSLTIESQPSGDKFDGKVRSGSQTTDLSGALPGLPDGDSVNDGIAARSGSLDNTADLTSPFTEGVDEGVSSGNERERTGVQESNESSPRTQNTGSSRGNRYGGHHAASLQALPSSENGAHFVYDKKGQMTPNRVAGSSGKSFYASNHGGSNKSLYSGSSPDRRYSNMPLSREVSTEALSNSNGPYNSFNTVPDSPNPSTKASSTYSRGKKPPDVNNWKEPKYTPRDKDAERSDPDFTRRNVPMPQPIAFTGPQMLPMAMMAGGQYPPRYPDGSNMVAPGGMYPMPVPYPMQQMPGMYPVQYMQGQGQWMPTPYYPPGAPMMGVSAPGQVYPGQPVYDYGQQQVIYTPYPAQQQQYQHQQQTQQQQPSQQQIPSSPPPRTLRDSRGSNGNGHRDNSNSQVRQNYNGNSNGNVSTNA